MHIKRQLRLLNTAFVVMMLLIGLIMFAVLNGLGTLRDATEWSKHTNAVLQAIFTVSRTYEAADQQGKDAITEDIDPNVLKAKREASLNAVIELKSKVADNQVQLKNVDDLNLAMLGRFAAQDKQVGTVKRENGKLSFDASVTAESVLTSKIVENAVLKLRESEVDLLNSRSERRTLTQYWIASGAMAIIICLAICSIILFVVARRGMLRRIEVAKSMSGAPADLIPQAQVEKWVRELEEADRKTHAVTYAI